jgi:hypothetical protein
MGRSQKSSAKEPNSLIDHIPEASYLQHQQELLKAITPFYFESEADSSPVGYAANNTVVDSLVEWINNYAAFLAHRDAWADKEHMSESIFLGVQTAHNFTSFWDYVGYAITMTFQLKIDESTTFEPVIQELRRLNPGDTDLIGICRALVREYQGDALLRKHFRHLTIDRISPVYMGAEGLPADPVEVLKMLDTALAQSYQRIIGALSRFHHIITNYAPLVDFGIAYRAPKPKL